MGDARQRRALAAPWLQGTLGIWVVPRRLGSRWGWITVHATLPRIALVEEDWGVALASVVGLEVPWVPRAA